MEADLQISSDTASLDYTDNQQLKHTLISKLINIVCVCGRAGLETTLAMHVTLVASK